MSQLGCSQETFAEIQTLTVNVRISVNKRIENALEETEERLKNKMKNILWWIAEFLVGRDFQKYEKHLSVSIIKSFFTPALTTSHYKFIIS